MLADCVFAAEFYAETLKLCFQSLGKSFYFLVIYKYIRICKIRIMPHQRNRLSLLDKRSQSKSDSKENVSDEIRYRTVTNLMFELTTLQYWMRFGSLWWSARLECKMWTNFSRAWVGQMLPAVYCKETMATSMFFPVPAGCSLMKGIH